MNAYRTFRRLWGVLCLLLWHVFVQGQTPYRLISWELGGKSGQSQVPANFVSGGIATAAPSAVLKLGPGFSAVPWYNGNGLTTTGTVATLAEAIAQNRYLSFVCTPESPISITALKLVPLSQNHSRQFAVFSSHLGFQEDKLIESFAAANTGNQLHSIPLTGHDNLSGTVEFRIYIYGLSDQYEALGIGDRAQGVPYDLALEGMVVDTQSPSVPQGLAAMHIRNTYFTLSWNAASDNLSVASYDVFVNGVLFGTSGTTSLIVSDLQPGASYQLSVRATDAAGNHSAQSKALAVTLNTDVTEPNNIGINVSHFADWDGDHVFTNVMRLGRKWFRGSEWGGTPASIDAQGWPTEDANLCVWHGISNMHGSYKMKFTGKATSVQADWGQVSVSNVVYDQQTNTTTADLNYASTDGAGLRLSFTGTNGGIKDLMLMRPLRPGATEYYDFNTTFSVPFKDMLSRFTTIRYLDWESTNGLNDSIWENRLQPGYYLGSWTRNVADWETVIQLSNETGKDAWINIPAKANDDFIRKLAQLFKEKLNHNLKLYVEFSNEVWNTMPGFSQSFSNMEAARAEVAAGNSSLNFDGSDNTWFWAWRRIAKRTVEISLIFRQVYGDDQMLTKVRPVLMWQQGNAQSTADNQLEWLDYYSAQTQKPINYYIYGAGGSGYYSPDLMSDNLTLDNIWSSAAMDTSAWRPYKQKDIFYSSAMGCRAMVYEGGPGFDELGHSTDVQKAAVNDPRITPNMVAHHRMWSAMDGDLFCYYRSTGDHQWGFAPDVYNINTMKYKAINQLNVEDRFPVTLGSQVPFEREGGQFDGAYPSWKSPSLGSYRIYPPDNWTGYLFRSAKQVVEFTIDFANTEGSDLEFLLDGKSVGRQTITGAEGSTRFTVSLEVGLHNLRIKLRNNQAFDLRKLSAAVAERYLSTETTFVQLPDVGSPTAQVQVLSNIQWTAAVNQSWLSLTTTSGNGNGELVLTAASNPTDNQRTAELRISAEGLPDLVVPVVQNANTTNLDPKQETELRAFPNPAGQFLQLGGVAPGDRILLIDAQGRTVLQQQLLHNTVNLSGIRPGLYTLQLIRNESVQSIKILKK